MRRFFVPEAIQSSSMDCGPASLKTLLEGFGIRASYGRLREACQTDVDGTSIDQIEEAACALGLDAVQVMIPLDHLFCHESDALPAILVVRQPNGASHFVVAWRRHGGRVQVMDPAIGRRWPGLRELLADVYEHTQPVPAAAWREWAGSESFLKPLAARIRRVGGHPERPIAAALQDTAAYTLARLDAATRMTEALIAAGALRRGGEGGRFLANLAGGTAEIPDVYWSAAADPENSEDVRMRGAILVQAYGKRKEPVPAPLSPELAAALNERPARPAIELLRLFGSDGWFAPALAASAMALAAAGTAMEAVLLRGLFDLGHELATLGQRAAAIAALLAFSAVLLAVDFRAATLILRIGRRLETRMRIAFLAKIPRLNDRYFQSRPVSDMAERCHNVQQLRQAPELASLFLRNLFGIVFTVAAIGWLYPESLWPAGGLAAIALIVPLLAQPALAERDLRLRSHSGALTRYYLDALLGLTAIRAHAAEQAVRREQLGVLREWARAGFALQRAAVAVEGVQFTLSLAVAVWLVWTRLAHGGEVGGMLLLVYWVLSLPAMGEEAATAVWQYPLLRSTALRLLEPLGAPEEPRVEAAPSAHATAAEVVLDRATVRAAGITILDGISVRVSAGEHVAIVGVSGAGKSSLVGLLLGWHRPAAGSVLVDCEPLGPEALDRLRRSTAWVDPQVQLWNRSLFDNLRYGSGDARAAMDEILDLAELRSVLRHLPDGLQTMLGEGGGLVSGGEGQRVRLGRAMMRSGVRLAILDEPARGLDRSRRRAMIERARERWRDATLLCITHDVSDTRDFTRVLVIDGGAIAEDGHPADLAANPDSRYRRRLEAEDAVRSGLWASAQWRRLRIENGKLQDAGAVAPAGVKDLEVGR